MNDCLWFDHVSKKMSAILEEDFPGVSFDVIPLVAGNVGTLDVSWTDGPSLEEVDSLSLEFVLGTELDAWGTSNHLRVDRISKRRSMSPAVEDKLLRFLAANLGMNVTELDMEQLYTLPPTLVPSIPRLEAVLNQVSRHKGTVPEFMNRLFEAAGFRAMQGLILGTAGGLVDSWG